MPRQNIYCGRLIDPSTATSKMLTRTRSLFQRVAKPPHKGQSRVTDRGVGAGGGGPSEFIELEARVARGLFSYHINKPHLARANAPTSSRLNGDLPPNGRLFTFAKRL
ncbi:hypothetical protein EVAR_62662_1 [Eumeta japonica]|uniref:Uncharacterized protein n=1 Tax=Eumeta variegata TaxID=151549 RepID=A0A4C1YZJ5_EUMVA|nr:hypothetical protein EVAR_62662_1 [Eumeta japonica]